ncbi:MAG: hypothetical protein M3Q48_04740, partial [Actinomycetota bacterium]|nr:hypothetical protein [Actinomycetota bacterium]
MAHRRRRRRWLPALVLAAAVVAVIAGAAAWHDVNKAKAELTAARTALVAVADDPASLRTSAGRRAAADDTRRAR